MRTESPFTHGTELKTAVVLANLGTPDAPTTPAVRTYLKQFLSDPRVVEIPRVIWWLILNGIILRIRPKKSAEKYKTVWTDDGSPLFAITKRQAAKLTDQLNAAGKRITVRFAMRYGNPAIPAVLDDLLSEGHDKVLILPMFPQYAAATVASVFDAVGDWMSPVRNVPEFRYVKHYHDHPAYIDALVKSVKASWEKNGRPDFDAGDKLLMSFHGVPRMTLDKGDPYHCECYKTARLVGEALGLEKKQYVVTFQSRFGRAEWLQPYTDVTLRMLPEWGTRRVDVLCPGFIADCLETLEEISQEGRETFMHAGGQVFNYIDCLNDSDSLVALLEALVDANTGGWPVDALSPEQRQQLELDLRQSRDNAIAVGAKQ